MPELRWILIVCGTVLLIGIYLWGRRGSQQPVSVADNMLRIPDPSDESHESSAFRAEPSADFGDEPVVDTSVAAFDEVSISAERRYRSSTDIGSMEMDADVPTEEVGEVSELPTRRVDRDHADRDYQGRRTRIEPTFGEDVEPREHSPPGTPVTEASAITVPAHERATVAPAVATPTASVPTLSMSETPQPRRSERRKIMALRIAAGAQRFTGEQLFAALLSEGLQHGKYDVFHRLADGDASVFSIASMVEPGTFDPANMQDETYPGITMFAQLPGPIDGLLAFNELLSAARRLQEKLGGVLQDDRGVPLTIHRIERLRQDVRDFQQGQARDARQSDPATHS